MLTQIDAGAGTDTYHTTSMVGATMEGTGTGTSTGVVINLGSTAVTGSTINATTTEFISGSLTSVGAGEAVYLFAAESSLNTATADTISNVENVTLAGNGINYVVGSSAANTIVGGSGVDTIIGGEGADTITGGASADVIDLTETTATADLVATDTADADAIVHTLSDNFITHTVATYLAGDSTIAELEGTIATALGTALTADYGSNHVLVAVDDGASTALVRYSDAGTDGAVVGEISVLGFISGLTDATTLTAENFAFA